MTFAHNQADTMHRRLERHRRQRTVADQDLTARAIRDAIETDQLERRLIFGNGGDSTGSTGSSGGSTTGSNTNSGSNSSGGNTNTGNSGTTEDTGSGNDEATTTPTRGATTTPRTTQPSTTRSSSTSTSSLTPTTTSSSSSSSSSSSTRTSSTPTTTSSSTRSSRTSSEIETPTSATSITDANSLATSVRVITQSPTSIASATASSSSTSDGPGAGPIIGIVAGALAGLVLLAAAVSYLVKWYSNRKTVDPYEANPFDRDDFRRQSVMIPDGFDSDDGHPSVAEHHNYGPGSYENEMTMANSATAASLAGGAAAGGAAAAATSGSSHNDSGRPRPPTMFARHADAHAPSVGAVFNQPPVVPQLPPMALGGGDPYSLAGVAGGMHNVSNPYAHLDRSNSENRFSPDQMRHQQPYSVGNVYNHYGQQHQNVGLERNGSNGSSSEHRGATVTSPESYGRRLDHGDEQNHRYETSGRPGTAEGRSGTPDIPNVQQTYALGDGTEDGHDVNGDGHNTPGSGRQSGLDYYSTDRPASSQQQARGSWSPPQLFSDHARSQDDEYFQQMQQQYGNSMSRPESVGASQGLQVRNLTGAAPSHNGQLLPNPHDQHRPRSMASSVVEDDDAAYGGVY